LDFDEDGKMGKGRNFCWIKYDESTCWKLSKAKCNFYEIYWDRVAGILNFFWLFLLALLCLEFELVIERTVDDWIGLEVGWLVDLVGCRFINFMVDSRYSMEITG
jgi:hypothetical protein